MKKGSFIGFCCWLTVLSLLVMAHRVESEVKDLPSAVFLEPKYEFDAVFEGIDVVHDFVIQNRGTATLEVKKVSGG